LQHRLLVTTKTQFTLRMQQLKILVTGGNGFVGRQICHLANQQGIQVISLSRTGQPATYAASPVPSVEWINAGIVDLNRSIQWNT